MNRYYITRHLKSINDEEFIINYGNDDDDEFTMHTILYRCDGSVFCIKKELSNKKVLKYINDGYIPPKLLAKWNDKYHERPYIDDYDIISIKGIIESSNEHDRKMLPLWLIEILILYDLRH